MTTKDVVTSQTVHGLFERWTSNSDLVPYIHVDPQLLYVCYAFCVSNPYNSSSMFKHVSNLVQITHTHNMVNINNQLIRGPLIRSHCENSRPVICLNLLRLLLIYSSVLRPSQSSFANLLFLILVIRYNTNKKVPLYNLITNI